MGIATRNDQIQAITEHYGVISLPYGKLLINRHDKLLPTNLQENLQEIGELCQYARGVVLDVGANVGSHSINFSQHADVVHAFEPQPQVFYNLCANLMLHHIHNVCVYNCALGSYEGVTNVIALDTTREGSPMGVAVGEGDQPVTMRTIDALGIAPVHFIKIDVEGHELEVLRGARETLSSQKIIVYVEIHREHLIDDVRQYMADLGYLEKRYIEVHTTDRERGDVILTVGYLFWAPGRIAYV